MPLATYSFLPWARQGVAAQISDADTLGNSNGVAMERASLPAELKLKYAGLDNKTTYATINKTIQIVGPGDVLSINPNAIVRTEPKTGVTNYEANGLPYVEFYEEDFLWRYTPAKSAGAAANSSKLRPWLTLVALKDDEFTFKPNSNGLPYISVKPAAFNTAFPSEKDTWAFAHVQVNQSLNNTDATVLNTDINAQVASNPDVAVSRLLCSRKLTKLTGYTAFLIPSYETGRLTGLGISPASTAAQAPAWTKGAMPGTQMRPYEFPVYFNWSFRTADFGDFESLATALKPVVMSGSAGKMPMDISNPGFGLAAAVNGTKQIGLQAALKPPSLVPDPWPTSGGTNTDDVATVNKLRELLNLSADLVDRNLVVSSPNPFFNTQLGQDPLLVPPVYGVWHALVQKLVPGGNPPWIQTLNLDFRNRAVAGLGTSVIQKYQEDFVNRAWEQVNKVNEANRRIQEASLARLVNMSLFKKHIKNAGNDKAVMMTNPIQRQIKNAGGTKSVHQDFVESRIPLAAKSAAFRKIARPNNKTERAISATSPVVNRIMKFNTLIKNFNTTDAIPLTTAPPKGAPQTALTATRVSNVVNAILSQYGNDKANLAKDLIVQIIDERVALAGGTLDKNGLTVALNARNPPLDVKTPALDLIAKIVSYPIAKVGDTVVVTIDNNKFSTLFGSGVHAKNYNNVILKDSSVLANVRIHSLTTNVDMAEKVTSFNTFNSKMSGLPKASVPPTFNNVQLLADQIFDKMNPAVTMAKKMSATIKVWQGGAYVPLPELKPVMAYPEFPEPVYNYLLELSKNYILPNIDQLADNSITLLQNNQSFIEAFMAGMNHEMARELLWREYPTDKRGSYFRQFWNISDNIFPASADAAQDKELKLDIKKINEWNSTLGNHSPRSKNANVVLVVRGELLKKYPNTMIYAQKAEYDLTDGSKPRKLKGGIDSVNTKFPLFKADIDPDITLCGFDLDVPEARGEKLNSSGPPPAGKNPGWFFVLKERPGQIRFGLDDFDTPPGNPNAMPVGNPATWNDFTWEHLVINRSDLASYHVNFSKSIAISNPAGQPVWGTSAADIASILCQNPVLFARHAAEMLP